MVTGLEGKDWALAAQHKPGDGKIQADAEFFAGFVALRFLDDRKGALAHFKRLYEGVNSPISRSRGAYWAGRAAASASCPKRRSGDWSAQFCSNRTTNGLCSGKPPVRAALFGVG